MTNYRLENCCFSATGHQVTASLRASPQTGVAISSINGTLHLNYRRFPRRFAPRNDRLGGALKATPFRRIQVCRIDYIMEPTWFRYTKCFSGGSEPLPYGKKGARRNGRRGIGYAAWGGAMARCVRGWTTPVHICEFWVCGASGGRCWRGGDLTAKWLKRGRTAPGQLVKMSLRSSLPVVKGVHKCYSGECECVRHTEILEAFCK